MLFPIVVVVVGIVVAAAFLWFITQSGAPGWSPTYVQPRQIQVSDLAALNASATQGHAFAGNNTLWFGSGAMTFVVYASPANHDMTFVIQGMVDPTIHVGAGSRVTLTMVNMDSDLSHNWAVTDQGPPHPTSSMMGSGGMMNVGTMMSMTVLGPVGGGMMWSQEMSFTTAAGHYWYVCMVAGHAAQGMYGPLVVG